MNSRYTTLINDSFLLNSDKSKSLYEKYAKNLPIVDYHCHLKPESILNDTKYKNITELWLNHDHYKWRLMRANGVDEHFITGNATDKEKFIHWAKTIEVSMGNPLYHWAHMELAMYFDIPYLLTSENAEEVFDICNHKLGQNGYSTRELIKKSNVKLIGTTDDPLSDLSIHKKLSAIDDLDVLIIPTIRVDKLINFNSSFKEFVADLNKVTKIEITTFEDYIQAIHSRLNFFNQQGCKSSDLGLGKLFFVTECNRDEESIFKDILDGKSITNQEKEFISSTIIKEMCKKFVEYNWVFQLHFGAVGSINNKLLSTLGKGKGFDTITDEGSVSDSLINMLNALNDSNSLPKMVVYNIDGTKNEVIQSILACFQENTKGIRGKMQHGSAWWFQDTKKGIEKQLTDLASQGILNNFIGMLTDSRSFISYSRHDYFRRILCNIIADWINNNEIPDDEKVVKPLIENVCYNNTIEYFELNIPTLTN